MHAEASLHGMHIRAAVEGKYPLQTVRRVVGILLLSPQSI